MFFEDGATYHVYNRSNETLFHNRENYLFFLRKIRKHILPYADILAYCLMPNHFHIILVVKAEGVVYSTVKKHEDMQQMAQAFGTMLSSYTQALNNQTQRRGNLFAHHTKSRKINGSGNNYGINCFMYVHQNPLLAGLVERMEDWEYSSFPDYIGKRSGTLINKQLGLDIFQLEPAQIYFASYQLLIDKSDEDFL
ncbi:hypothetical protein [Parabacteroides sp. FAFU027]|uniref:hypothetical protein n=1 Tax=Parabacteroides sp. FAFU027 TaxID=2922715 RepID=UPI001FB047BC|nr:hypothetical protein [Parabacteroides sp. FAFU027]